MKKSTSAIAVAGALLFSTAAFAQQASDSTPPNMRTTPDGVTPTPDATVPPSKSKMDSGTHKKHSSKKHHKSAGSTNDSSMGSGSSGATSDKAPNMQTTPDGVTRTPDSTVPATR
jgi:hypothetical protein